MDNTRILDYFATIGLDSQCTVNIQQTENIYDEHQYDVSIVQSVKFIKSQPNQKLLSSTPFCKYILMSANQCDKLWLQINYSIKKQCISRKYKKTGIHSLGFFQILKVEGILVVPNNLEIVPLPLEKNTVVFSDENNMYYQGLYDLNQYFQLEVQQDYALVFGYTECVHLNQMPISKVKVIQSDDQNVVKIPEEYFYLNLSIGKLKNQILCFERVQNPLQLIFKPELINKFPRENYQDFPFPHGLPMFCFTNGLQLQLYQKRSKMVPFMLQAERKQYTRKVPRTYVQSYIFYEQIPEKLALKLGIVPKFAHKYFLPKAICLLSLWSYMRQYQYLLEELWKISKIQSEIPIERVVCNFMQEIPLPDRGVTQVFYNIGQKTLEFTRPPQYHLPFTSMQSIAALFRMLSIPNIIQVFLAVLLERKILIVYKDQNILTHMCMALNSIIFPFNWQQIMIPLLPAQLNAYVEAIIPYIIGVTPKEFQQGFDLPGDHVVVFLEKDEIYFEEAIPQPPIKVIRELQNLLLNRPTSPIMKKNAKRQIQLPIWDHVSEVISIQDAFIQFMCKILKNYDRFYTRTQGDIRIKDCFELQKFLAHHNSKNPDSFLYNLTQTSLFTNFIESRFSNDDYGQELRYFDQAFNFRRTFQDPFFVKFYSTSINYQVLSPSEVGIDPGTLFSYEFFPRFNDGYFIEPRLLQPVQRPASNHHKQMVLNRNDTLLKMTPKQWAIFLMTNIYKLWFILCSNNIVRFKNSGIKMLNLALAVLEKMKQMADPDEEIYRKLIEICGKCGLRSKVQHIFKQMIEQNIEPDACTHTAYVRAVVSNSSQLSIDNDLSPRNCIWMQIDLQKCIFWTDSVCPGCNYKLNSQDIFEGWSRSFDDYNTQCPMAYCRERFIPKFTVIWYQSNGQENQAEVEFLCPTMLFKEVENYVLNQGEEKLQLVILCQLNSVIFWNIALYFNLVQLPTFFLNARFDIRHLTHVIQSYMKNLRDNPKQGDDWDKQSIQTCPETGTQQSIRLQLQKVFGSFINKFNEENSRKRARSLIGNDTLNLERSLTRAFSINSSFSLQDMTSIE